MSISFYVLNKLFLLQKRYREEKERQGKSSASSSADDDGKGMGSLYFFITRFVN